MLWIAATLRGSDIRTRGKGKIRIVYLVNLIINYRAIKKRLIHIPAGRLDWLLR